MKPKTMVLMGVAIACGLGASYMTSRLLAERNSDDDPKIDVLVAKKTLNIGDTIKSPEEVFQIKHFTKGDEPVGAVTDLNELKNRVLKRPLRLGDHVTPEDLLSDRDDGWGAMPIVLPVGMRAVGIKVNLESGAFGWATLPLARVDVISTVRRADDKATYSQVLLEDVLVLAADDKMRRSEDGKSMVSQIVTVALKPEDVLKVRLAGELGSLSLALRKINDKSRVENGKLSYDVLKAGEAGLSEPIETVTAPKTVTPPPPPPPTPVVQAPKDPTPEKEPLTKHVVAVSEGGRTRYFEYYFNEHGEIVQPDGSATGDSHPPRPQDAVVPGSKK
jgi:pilus assembly protein CpaB